MDKRLQCCCWADVTHILVQGGGSGLQLTMTEAHTRAVIEQGDKHPL